MSNLLAGESVVLNGIWRKIIADLPWLIIKTIIITWGVSLGLAVGEFGIEEALGESSLFSSTMLH